MPNGFKRILMERDGLSEPEAEREIADFCAEFDLITGHITQEIKTLIDIPERRLKVEPIYRNQGQEPFSKIRLKGAWLQKAGFEPGDKVKVAIEAKRLTIELVDKAIES